MENHLDSPRYPVTRLIERAPVEGDMGKSGERISRGKACKSAIENPGAMCSRVCPLANKTNSPLAHAYVAMVYIEERYDEDRWNL